MRVRAAKPSWALRPKPARGRSHSGSRVVYLYGVGKEERGL